jgi:hypothetical protein
MLHTLELARRATRLRTIAVISGILAILTGCNTDDNLAPAPTVAANFDSAGTDSTSTDSTITDSLALAWGEPLTAADSVGLADSVALADSLAAAGVVMATEEASLEPEFAMAAASTKRMHFGAYDCTPSGRSAYTLCNRSAGKWTAAEIRALQRAGARTILNQGGYGKFKDSRGRYSPSKYYRWVRSHRRYASSWKPFVRSGVLVGVQVIDDRGATNWGGRPISNAQIEQMAKWWKQLVPGITTFVAGGYASNLLGYKWRYLDGSINQYNASYMGSVKAWRDKAVAAAAKARTSLILSLNVLNGGKITRGCYRGGRRNMCSMNANEIRTYGAAIANARGVCGAGTWKYSSTYQRRPGVTYALKYVAKMAANRPLVSCKRR